MVFSISCPTMVRFGANVSAALADHLPEGAQAAVLVRGSKSVASAGVRAQLEAANLTVRDVICAGEPSVEAINRHVAEVDLPDVVIACGGGAVLDTGKALAFCMAHGVTLGDDFGAVDAGLLAQPCPLPLIALPTTAGTGAEVTANAVLDVAAKRAKVSLRGRALYPHLALVDPSLMRSAPPGVVLASGLDAVTQIIEAYTSNAATPFTDAVTAPNVARGLRSLRDVVERGGAADWCEMAWVSLSSGLALANGGLGAAHGLASVLGGRYGAPHGALCGRLLIPVLRQNLARAEVGSEDHFRLDACIEAIAACFLPDPGRDDLSGLDAWITAHGLPRLGAYGVEKGAIAALAEAGAAASSSQKNAVRLSIPDYAQVLEAAL